MIHGSCLAQLSELSPRSTIRSMMVMLQPWGRASAFDTLQNEDSSGLNGGSCMLDRLVVKLAMSMGPIDAAVTQMHSHLKVSLGT